MCYINDIIDIAEKSDILISLYADDAVIYHTSDDGPTLQTKMQSALNDVSRWCESNHIKLNVNKTKLCCYGTRPNLKNIQISCKLKDSTLHLCKQYSYLGVTLDETMNLESNFNVVFKKFSYKLFQFSKIRKYLPQDVRVLVYKQAVLESFRCVIYINKPIY